MSSFTRLAAATSAALLLATLAPVSSTSAADRCWRHKTSERSFARKINRARRRAGAPRLRLDRHLTKVARGHTRAMTERNDLFHSTRLGRRVTNWTELGENVGVGGTVRSLHGAFMRSLDHRLNIQSRRFRHVGIGVRRSRGRLWVTIVFQSESNPGTTLPMPRC